MPFENRSKKLISRRQFIQTGATAAAGLFLGGCAGNPSAVEAPPTRAVAQLQATNTPVPPLATTSPTVTSPSQSSAVSAAGPHLYPKLAATARQTLADSAPSRLL